MLRIAWYTLRGRRVSFIGGALTLVFGVALISSAGVVISDAPIIARHAPESVVIAVSQAGQLLALFAGIGAFLTIFVVAGTFAFTVAQRRKELALLRIAGAGPGQVRRMVLTETALLGSAAALVGAVLGLPFTTVLAAVLTAEQVLPPGIDLPLTPAVVVRPLLIAFALGVLVALLGAWPAAHRAGSVRPVEMLREAAVDVRRMPFGRWLLGVVALAAGLGVVVLLPHVPPEGQLPLAMLAAQPVVVGLAVLAPVIVPPVTGLLAVPLVRLTRASGLLARESLRTAVRRTASCAAPVLLTLGVTGSLLAGTDLLGAASRANAALLYTSDLHVRPASPGAFGHTVPAAVGTVPGVRAAVLTEDVTVSATVDRAARDFDALGVDGAGLPDVLGLGQVTGGLDRLTGNTVALSRPQAESFGSAVGGTVTLRLPDGAPAVLRVVAVYSGPPLATPLLVPMSVLVGHDSTTGYGASPAVQVAVAHGADVDTVRRALSAALPGTTVLRTAEWLSGYAGARQQGMNLGATLLAWLALIYTLFAVANTVIMSFGLRSGEFTLLRLLGTRRGQVLRVVAWEATVIAATGVLLGAAATALTVGGLWQVLRSVGLDIPLTVPWARLSAIAFGCVAVVFLASCSTAALMLRSAPRPALAE
jgi:putative ABC transport system permease protein